MYMPILVVTKPADGYRSFLGIFLFIHPSNCMQSAVSLQALFCYDIFPVYQVRSRTKVGVRWTVIFKGIMHLNFYPRLFIKRVDRLCSPSGKFLLIHHTSYLQALRLCGGTSQLRSSLLGVALVLFYTVAVPERKSWTQGLYVMGLPSVFHSVCLSVRNLDFHEETSLIGHNLNFKNINYGPPLCGLK